MEFNLQIVPYVSDRPLVAAKSYVRVTPQAQEYVKLFVDEIRQIKDVSTPEGLGEIRSAQGRVQSLLKQIEAASELAKTPLRSLINSVTDVSEELSLSLEHEKERLTGLLGLAAQLEQSRRDSIKRAAEEAHRKEVEAKKAVELRLQEESQKLRIAAAQDMDLEQAAVTRRAALRIEMDLAEAAYNRDLAENTQVVVPKFTAPLVEGASSVKDIDINDKIDLVLLLVQTPEFIRDVATFSPKKNVIKDKFKRLKDDFENKGVENPTSEAVDYFSKTGITITVSFKPQVRQSARIVK